MKVVIGYDGSESARAAIAELTRAGIPRDAQVLVVSAADVWPQLPKAAYEACGGAADTTLSPMQRKAHALAAESLAGARGLAAEGEALVKEAFASWKVSHEAFAGSPNVALSRPELGADLVVVGSQGRSALGRMVLGSVSQNVLMHAPCSVRISRGSAASASADRAVRIVLGVDGSRQTALAISALVERDWPNGTEVKVITVLDRSFWTALANPQSSAWGWMVEVDQDGRAWAMKAVQNVEEELRAAGLTTTSLVVEGDPKKVLMEEAQRWQADCIFVGAKGLGAIERLVLGSVSSAVAARAHCSVEVVRQG